MLQKDIKKSPVKSARIRNLKENLVHGFFFFNGILVIIVLLGIFALLVFTSIPAFKEISLIEFLFSENWNPTSYVNPVYGVLAMVVSTFMTTFGALLITIPLGIGTAAYLSDIANPRLKEIVKPIIEILAGIPSVVIGFLGIVLVGPLIAKIFRLYNGLNALNGSILLAVMALPTIISLSEDALNSVPKSYEMASLALGANKWQTIIMVKIPAALSGIIAACMLDMGRVIGETMAILMATGCAPAMPKSFQDSVRTMTSTIAIELGEVPDNTTYYYAIFGIGLLLFIISFFINMVSEIILHKYQDVDVVSLRKKVGMVFQKSNPFPKSIFENVAYGLRVNGIRNKGFISERVEKSLKDAALLNEVKGRLTESAFELSGGQQQRLCIARALAIEPEVILMDEPASALDPTATSKIEKLIQELKKRYTIVIVTHNMQQAARISDYTAFFMLGELIEYDIASKIFTNPTQKITEDYITGRFG